MYILGDADCIVDMCKGEAYVFQNQNHHFFIFCDYCTWLWFWCQFKQDLVPPKQLVNMTLCFLCFQLVILVFHWWHHATFYRNFGCWCKSKYFVVILVLCINIFILLCLSIAHDNKHYYSAPKSRWYRDELETTNKKLCTK